MRRAIISLIIATAISLTGCSDDAGSSTNTMSAFDDLFETNLKYAKVIFDGKTYSGELAAMTCSSDVHVIIRFKDGRKFITSFENVLVSNTEVK